MAEIALAIHRPLSTLTQEQRDAMRAALLGCVDGVDDSSKRSWRRFWSRVGRMELGECFSIATHSPRNPKFHRKFFALLKVGFDAWEPARKRKTYQGMEVAKNFDQFREDITILAGFYTQTFDLRGRMVLKAKSIKFSQMEEEEFERLYSAVVDVLLQRVLKHYKSRAELDSVVELVMGFA